MRRSGRAVLPRNPDSPRRPTTSVPIADQGGVRANGGARNELHTKGIDYILLIILLHLRLIGRMRCGANSRCRWRLA